ncbi:DVU0298 family protein [Pseudodesulfovibrio senegalensis]|jgi:HEAT repeat protein|uniref:HEAT repeat domain-containing protein n=1 Tax=Pseudodesulfovibrio senegalensis TaxID=1721087 RepID=A0A6N6N8V1_9BACT|nr:DVU0298 family protein [Pseudodesulfovibrio senegalensis]KAB1443347.1 HEAT repeat domain-containing protein [Pseudodesulfovibrio senegalensis]
MSRFRRTKKDVRVILAASDWRQRLAELEQWEPGSLVAPLFSLRLDADEDVRWRTVVAFGLVAGRIAEANMEKARVLMRTFMWHMNEESGNLGWGIPEAMAEAMVNNARIADEFSSILASYIYCDSECDGNYLDHPDLRRGVFWGLGRLASVRPELVAPSVRFLRAGLEDEDAHNRGLAARALGILRDEEAAEPLQSLLQDASSVRVFQDDAMRETTVAVMAREAMDAIGVAPE